MKRHNTLSGRMSLYAGGALLLLAGLFLIIFHQVVSSFLEHALHDKATALARQLATVSLDTVLIRDYGTLERYVADLVKQEGIDYIRIQREDGEILGEAGEAAPPRPEEGRAEVREPIFLSGQRFGDITVAYDTREVSRLIRQFTLAGLAGILLLIAVLFWLHRYLVKRFLIEPIQQLASYVSPLQHAHSDPPSEDQPEEIARLMETFNRLRSEIDAYIRQLEQAHQLTRAATERLCREQRLATVGQMAAGLAHGLNTPLGNILGYSQLASHHTAEADTRNRLEVIEKQARACATIVSNLLTAARQPEPVGQPIELTQLLQEMLQLMLPVLQDRGVREAKVVENGPCWAWADPTALEQVIFNLLTNAAQAGCNTARITARYQESHAIIEIEDDGTGIPAELHEALFEPFTTSKPAGQGTGLGLYVCTTLLHATAGQIRLVESRAGRTVFEIVLPQRSTAGPETRPPRLLCHTSR